MSELLTELLRDPRDQAFALLRRGDSSCVQILHGTVVTIDSLADIPLRAERAGEPDVLVAIPYRQVTERGFVCHDDGSPMLCLVVTDHETVDAAAVLELLPDDVDVSSGRFEPDDETYAAVVERIIRDEIGNGAGANFVIRRDFHAHTRSDHTRTALGVFGTLLEHERGAYWTFAFVHPQGALVGATPERHVSAQDSTVMMNPISGTYRHGQDGPRTSELLEFLRDSKETDELFMVVDEELKMMSAVCERGGRVIGPFLKEMSHLTHTEYLLEGTSTLDVRDILRSTMFAPTVTGSPIENAARVIARYESGGRGYYSGVLALIGHDDAERQTLDAPILIRTCEISASGSIRASVGATLVRGSSPQHEVAETHAKLGGLLSALGAVTRAVQPRSDDRPVCSVEVADALRRRNTKLARFWVDPQPQDGVSPPDDLAGTHALIVNFEDEWTAMLAHQLRHLGMKVDTRRWDRLDSSDDIDLVVAGPGPGDPRDDTDPRIAAAGSLLTERIGAGRPTVAICLSHQVLARQLGFPIRRLPEPHQGTQDRIDLFGTRTDVGFYNTFSAFADAKVPGVSVSADRSGAVHALVGPGFASSQFHPESLLTSRGIDILRAMARAASATTPMTTLAF